MLGSPLSFALLSLPFSPKQTAFKRTGSRSDNGCTGGYDLEHVFNTPNISYEPAASLERPGWLLSLQSALSFWLSTGEKRKIRGQLVSGNVRAEVLFPPSLSRNSHSLSLSLSLKTLFHTRSLMPPPTVSLSLSLSSALALTVFTWRMRLYQ